MLYPGLIARATGGAFFAGLGLVDFDVATFEVALIQAFDGGVGLGVARHFHEAETLRLSGKLVGYQAHARHLAKLGESLFKIAFGYAIGKIANIYVHESVSQKYELLAMGAIEARNAQRVRCQSATPWPILQHPQHCTPYTVLHCIYCFCQYPFTTRLPLLQAKPTV